MFFYILSLIKYLLYFIVTDKGKKKYLLILEYADSGTLRKYLQSNFESISWHQKLKFGYEIASAVSCLHKNDIIHRDLVTKRSRIT